MTEIGATYTYDANNRLLLEDRTQHYITTKTYYEYDKRGNQISKRSEITEGVPVGGSESEYVGLLGENPESTVELYTYDGFNRLSEVSTKSGRVRYQYNAEGIRTSKAANGVTTSFLLDGVNVIGEVANGGDVTTYLRGVTGLISQKKPDNTRLYYVTNGHGDVTAMVNPSGSITKTYTYDAFGVEQYPDPNDTNPFRYCGEYFDKETNSIYLRARYYNPGVGRFTQQDPAMADGMNWYNYCGGNPLSLKDPMGTTWAYFDSFLSDEDRAAIEYYTQMWLNSAPGDTHGNSIPTRDYWHSQAQIVRNKYINDKYYKWAEQDFETFGITEDNYWLFHEGASSYTQALYEHAMDLQQQCEDGLEWQWNAARDKDGKLKDDFLKHAEKMMASAAGGGKPSLGYVSKNKANELARKNGFENAEAFKDAIVKKGGSQFNMKINKKTGEIFLEGIKNGKQVPTGYYAN